MSYGVFRKRPPIRRKRRWIPSLAVPYPSSVDLQRYLVWDGVQIRETDLKYIALVDGVIEPDTLSGFAWLYIDLADGDLKVKFGDGTVTVIAADT